VSRVGCSREGAWRNVPRVTIFLQTPLYAQNLVFQRSHRSQLAVARHRPVRQPPSRRPTSTILIHVSPSVRLRSRRCSVSGCSRPAVQARKKAQLRTGAVVRAGTHIWVEEKGPEVALFF